MEEKFLLKKLWKGLILDYLFSGLSSFHAKVVKSNAELSKTEKLVLQK